MCTYEVSLEPNQRVPILPCKGESHIAHAEKLGPDEIYIGNEYIFSLCFIKEGAME